MKEAKNIVGESQPFGIQWLALLFYPSIYFVFVCSDAYEGHSNFGYGKLVWVNTNKFLGGFIKSYFTSLFITGLLRLHL